VVTAGIVVAVGGVPTPGAVIVVDDELVLVEVAGGGATGTWGEPTR
jgi:hypothetical protein